MTWDDLGMNQGSDTAKVEASVAMTIAQLQELLAGIDDGSVACTDQQRAYVAGALSALHLVIDSPESR